jgi:putative endopeptidase
MTLAQRILLTLILAIPNVAVAATADYATRLGVLPSAMDTTIRPQDDFFRYVNGTWLKTFKMPADKARYGAFTMLHDESELAVKEIITTVPAGKRGSNEQKIADMYASFMDQKTIARRGLKPIAKDLKKIRRLKNKQQLLDLFAERTSNGMSSPLGLYVSQDDKNVEEYITHFTQSGLGLPDRDYYFKDDERTKKVRTAYMRFITRLLQLNGDDAATEKAERIYALEKKMAEHHWTRVDRRDADKTYNKTAIGDLPQGLDWPRYLQRAGVRKEETHVIVAHPSFFTGFIKVFAASELRDWQSYLEARTLHGYAGYLSEDFVTAAFLYRQALSGQKEIRPRWKRGVQLVNGALGEIVGQIYVARHFPASSKTRMVELVETLRKAYGERIQGLSWMGKETKAKALDKLAKFTPKIGYPDKWKDYSKLVVKKNDLIGNVKRSGTVEYQRMLAKLGKPLDRGEWFLTPQTVNAYFNPPMNEIVFPAAILQPPFFNPQADDAVNYGAIGGVIGHEMGHGFDDQGAKYNGEGTLKNWWSDKDKAAFKTRTQMLVAQYSEFEPLKGQKINGELTQGENIGDLGGLTVAYHAYNLSLQGKPATEIDGFSGQQRFFLGWAQVWRSAIRDKALSVRLNTDPHSPAEYRVNGVVRNMPEFYKTFGVKSGDKMFLPEKKRVSIW